MIGRIYEEEVPMTLTRRLRGVTVASALAGRGKVGARAGMGERPLSVDAWSGAAAERE
jgi:hypothetical protein